MTAPSAWRPLSEAPKDRAIFVKCKGMRFVSPANDEFRCSHEGALFVPMVADTLELDRAVQKAVAEAFGALLSRLLAASQQEHLASFAPPKQTWVKKRLLREANESRQRGLRAFSAILHTSMGDRIPDEVTNV